MTLLLAVCSLTLAAGPTYAERVEGFVTQAKKERARLGLSEEEASARYPAANLARSPASDRIPTVLPGAEVTVTFRGKVPPGSMTLLGCEDVEVRALEVSEGGVRVQVKVPSTHVPTICPIVVFSPVSGSQCNEYAFAVGGRHRWTLQLANGMAAEWSTKSEGGDGAESRSTWSRKGKPPVERSLSLSCDGASPPECTVQVATTDQEEAVLERKQRAWLKGTRKAQRALERCEGLPENQEEACEVKLEGTMAKLEQQQNELLSLPSACRSVSMNVHGGKLAGTASGCDGSDDVKVTGTVTFLGR